jgi:ABC-type transport system involved in multi-copper enzyme maturation permease subunit
METMALAGVTVGLYSAAILNGPVWPFLIALPVIALVLVVRVLTHSKVYVVGPLFFYDVIRLARRGRSTLLRVTFALVLFGGLCFIYNERFPQQKVFQHPFAPGPTVAPQDVGQFANIFVGIILVLQALAVLVLTPAYLAGAIAEEKERRTLELLFTTHLTDREIVLGKLFGRLIHLLGILLVSLPILGILQFWGGANPLFIGAAFACCAFSVLSIGSVSILCSVLARNVLNAILLTYAVVFLVSFGCLTVPKVYVSSPLTFIAGMEEHMGTSTFQSLLGLGRPPMTTPGGAPREAIGVRLAVMVGTYGIVHVVVALFCLALAVAVVRATALGQAQSGALRPPPVERARIPVARPVARARDRDVEPVRRRPLPREPRGEFYRAVPVGNHPLLWKEVHHGAYDYTMILLLGLVPLVIAAFVGLVLLTRALVEGKPYYTFARDFVNPAIRVVCLILAGTWAASVAFLAGRSITREREQQTLDGLLTLPVDREAILGAKWLGSVLRGRHLGYCLAAFLAFGCLTAAIHPVGVLLMALAYAIHIAFLASVGVCLSLVCRNSLWANLTMALMLLLVFVGSSVVLVYTQTLGGPGAAQGWWAAFSEYGLNPPRSWYHLGFSWDQFNSEVLGGDGLFRGSNGATLAGLFTFAVASGVFWLAARAQFRREQVRERV